MLTRFSQRALLATALCAALLPTHPVVAPAAPSAAAISARQRAVETAVAEYASARSKAAAVEASLTAASESLDALVAEQQTAQRRLAAHVAVTYRYGPLGFLEVITRSVSFEQFASRLFLFSRIGEQEAAALAALKQARRRSLSQGRRLLTLQRTAANRLAASRAAMNDAKQRLASDRAAYASYLSRVAAIDAAPKAAAPVRRAKPYQDRSGSGEWKTGKASHYGRGSWGHRTADGTRIRSDSMIVAHKTLPFGTLVEFEYDGKRAVARVADRGPYVKGRMWDLGPGVIDILDFNGVHEVRYRVIGR